MMGGLTEDSIKDIICSIYGSSPNSVTVNPMSVMVLLEADIPVKSLNCVIFDLASQRNHVHSA